LDLPIRLRSVGAGSLVHDPESNACLPPGIGAVGGPVVREHPLDGDAAIGEPGDSAFKHADSGDGLLVRTDLGIGDTGVVIDDGVQKRGADTRPVVASAFTSPARLRLRIGFALLSAEEL